MKPESAKLVFNTVNDLFAVLGKALEIEGSGYEIGLKLIREHGNKTVLEVLQILTQKLVPDIASAMSPEQVQQLLQLMDTPENAFECLLTLEEPTPDLLDQISKNVSAFPVGMREVLLPVAKRLPHDPGGRPPMLPSPEERQRIRDEIAKLRAHGVRIGDAQERVAQRTGLKKSMIRRIWQEIMQGEASQKA